MKKRWIYRYFSLPLLALTLAFAGCATSASYKAPLGSYKEANTLVVENTRTIITQANQVERDIYIDKQVRHHSAIDIDGLHDVEVFSQDQLAARLRALDIMDAYGTLLLRIVNAEAPQTITETSGTLAKDVTNLLGMMAKLQGTNNAAFKSASVPAANLVSQVAGLAMEQKMQEALKTAVETGYEPMQKLIALLSEETYGAYKRKRAQLLRAQRYLLEDYDAELKKGASLSESALKKNAEQIKSQLSYWEESAEANPDLLFAAMAKAQESLLAYVRSDKMPRDTDDFSSAMADYLARVKQVGSSIKDLGKF
jgi:hypothetical protein